MLKTFLTVLFFLGASTSLVSAVQAESSELSSYKKKALGLNDTLLKNGELPKNAHDELKRRIQEMTDDSYKKNQKILVSTFDTLNKMNPSQRKRFIDLSIFMIQNGMTPPLPTASQ